MASWNRPLELPPPPLRPAPVLSPESVTYTPEPTDALAAVADPGGLRLPRGGIAVNVSDSAAVLQVAATHGIRQVWIGPLMQAHLYAGGPWTGRAVRAGWELVSGSSTEWIELRRQGVAIEVALLPKGSENPFAGASSALELLEALALFTASLRLRYRYSPGATGLALMRAVHSGRGGVRLPEAGSPAPPALGAQDWLANGSWIAGSGSKKGWLHAYDINGMFLAACSSIDLGFGEPHCIKKPSQVDLAPGYYRASIIAPKDGLRLPIVADGKGHWYPTPAIELAQEVRCIVRLHEAWVYPERHRWLEPWYRRLRDARTTVGAQRGPAARLAASAIKQTYLKALGRLSGSWLQPGDAAFRPEWRAAVIARAFANQHRHLVRIAQQSKVRPSAQDVDTVVYALPQGDAGVGAEAIGLPLSDQLGKWRIRGSIAAKGAPKTLVPLLKAMGARGPL